MLQKLVKRTMSFPVDRKIDNIMMGRKRRRFSHEESSDPQPLTGEEWMELFEDRIPERKRAIIRGSVRQGTIDELTCSNMTEKAYAHSCYVSSKRRGLLTEEKVCLPSIPLKLKPSNIGRLEEEAEGEREKEEEEGEEEEEESGADSDETSSGFLSSLSKKKKRKRKEMEKAKEEGEEEGELMGNGEKGDGKKRKRRKTGVNSSGSKMDISQSDSVPLLILDGEEEVEGEGRKGKGEEDGEEGEEEDGGAEAKAVRANSKWNGKKGVLDKNTTSSDMEAMDDEVRTEVIDHLLCNAEKHPSLYLTVVKKLLEKKELQMHMLRQKSKIKPHLPDDIDLEDHEDLSSNESESNEFADELSEVDGKELRIKGTKTYSFKNKTIGEQFYFFPLHKKFFISLFPLSLSLFFPVLDQTNRLWRGKTFHHFRFRKSQPWRNREGKWCPYWETSIPVADALYFAQGLLQILPDAVDTKSREFRLFMKSRSVQNIISMCELCNA